MSTCSKHVEAWNKLIIKFSASSWLILRNKYIEMHGQQNIKKSLCNIPCYQTPTCLKEVNLLTFLNCITHCLSRLVVALGKGEGDDLQKLQSQAYKHKITSVIEVGMHYPTACLHFMSHHYTLWQSDPHKQYYVQQLLSKVTSNTRVH